MRQRWSAVAELYLLPVPLAPDVSVEYTPEGPKMIVKAEELAGECAGLRSGGRARLGDEVP